MIDEIFLSLDVVIYQIGPGGSARRVTPAPAWLDGMGSAEAGEALEERMPYLEVFLAEAEEHWDRGEASPLHSGRWTEDCDGEERAFSAIAILANNRRLLLIAPAPAERTAIIQRAREARLEADRARARTERHAASLEELVDQRTAELRQKNRELRRALRARAEADERSVELRDALARVARLGTLGEMGASLAHELNQPLTALSNYARALVRSARREDIDPERVSTAAARISEQAIRAGDIVRRMRDFVGTGTPERAPASLADLVREVTELLEVEARHGMTALTVEAESGLPDVLVDPVQIQQILVNLVKNAIEEMDAIAPVERECLLAVRRADDGVEVEVADTGPGCPDDVLELIFDAFYTTKNDGMGIGLAICRSIAEAHGGSLTVRRREPRGLSFLLRLPGHDGLPSEEVS